jgi:hypothetical protein
MRRSFFVIACVQMRVKEERGIINGTQQGHYKIAFTLIMKMSRLWVTCRVNETFDHVYFLHDNEKNVINVFDVFSSYIC